MFPLYNKEKHPPILPDILEMLSDKNIKAFFMKLDYRPIYGMFLIMAIIQSTFLFVAIIGQMSSEKIVIVNPEFLSASPQKAYDWIERIMLPLIPAIKVLNILILATFVSAILALYQQYQAIQFRRHIKKIKISVIK